MGDSSELNRSIVIENLRSIEDPLVKGQDREISKARSPSHQSVEIVTAVVEA